jgi:hypothetical protein
MEAARWNDMEMFIGKCVTEKDLEKLRQLKERNIKENVAKALDRHFADLTTKKGKR